MGKMSFIIPILFLTVLFSVNVAFAAPTDDFVITVKTDNHGTSSNTQFTIPTFSGETYNYNVDCDNDGVNEAAGVSGDYTCNYSSAGTYTIRIKRNDGGGAGTSWNGFPRIYFENSGDKHKILSVNQWGTVKWSSMQNTFSGCSNLNSASAINNGGGAVPDWATDSPDLSNVTSMHAMFARASSFNQPLDNWETGNVIDMSWMFVDAFSFNQPLNKWDTRNVTNMSGMFAGAPFNQPLNNWDTGNVTNMSYIFYNEFSFNQPLDNWDTKNVIDMSWMFARAFSFNQPLGNWDVGNVTNMSYMFYEASSFNQNLGNWDVRSLVNATEMFGNIALSVANYDSLLIGWSSQNLKENVNFSGGNSKYCRGEGARDNIINNYHWRISDGGKDCYVPWISGILEMLLI